MANVNSVGFKGSRAELADVFSVTGSGVSSIAIGNGVRLSSVAQQFGQGNIEFTNSNLDLAISGQGFFTIRNDRGLAYPRAVKDRKDVAEGQSVVVRVDNDSGSNIKKK